MRIPFQSNWMKIATIFGELKFSFFIPIVQGDSGDYTFFIYFSFFLKQTWVCGGLSKGDPVTLMFLFLENNIRFLTNNLQTTFSTFIHNCFCMRLFKVFNLRPAVS